MLILMGNAEYLDQDNSGTHTECVTDNVADAFQPLATWLQENKRQAIVSESGASMDASVSLRVIRARPPRRDR